MFDLIEIELKRIRRMAEQENDSFLLYLIDLASIEANAKACSCRDRSEAITPVSLRTVPDPTDIS